MIESTGFTIRVVEVTVGIPTGSALTYAQVAERAGFADEAESVESIMREHRHDGLPWWRVVPEGGNPPSGTAEENLAARALEHYLREGTPILPSPGDAGYVIDLVTAHSAEPTALIDPVAPVEPTPVDDVIAGLESSEGEGAEGERAEGTEESGDDDSADKPEHAVSD